MTKLHRTDRDDAADRSGIRIHRRLRQLQAVGSGRRRPRRARRRACRASAPAIASGCGSAAASPRWSTGSRLRAAEPGRAGRLGIGCRRGRRDPVRAGRDRHPYRLHGRHPAGRLAAARPAVPGPGLREARPQRGRRACDGRSTDRAEPRSERGTPAMRIAVVGAGVSGLTAAYALAPRARRPAVRGRAAGRRSRQDGRGRDGPTGRSPVDTGFIVYNERTYPTLRPPARPSSASRPSRATCRSARPAARATSSSARAGLRGCFARPRRVGPAGALADDRGHPPLLPRRPADASTRGAVPRDAGRLPRGAAASGPGSATTSSSRSRPRSGPPPRTGSSSSRSTTCSGSSTTTVSSATATPCSGGRSRGGSMTLRRPHRRRASGRVRSGPATRW